MILYNHKCTKRNIKKIILIWPLVFSNLILSGQATTYTQREIDLQDKFVEGKKYALIGDYDKAEEIFKKLYDEYRTNGAIALELAKIYDAKEDYFNAFAFAQKALKNDPDEEMVWDGFVKIAFHQQKWQEAIEPLKKLFAKKPDSAHYADLLSTAYLRLELYDQAVEVYKKLESRIGISEESARRRFEIYDLHGDRDKAVAVLKELIAAFPRQVRYAKNLAAYYTRNGMEKKALGVYKDILKIDPEDPTANLAVTKSQGKDAKDNNYLLAIAPIIENHTIGIDQKMDELKPYLEKATRTGEKELIDALLHLSEKLTTTHHEESRAHEFAAKVFSLARKYKDAVKAYQKSLSLDDRKIDIWIGLMETLIQTSDSKTLQKTAMRVLDLFPNNPDAYRYYGLAFMKSDTDDAIDVLKEGLLVAGKKESYLSNINATLAMALCIKGKKDEAMQAAKKALEFNDKNSIALEAMGDVHYIHGDIDKALDYWKKAKKAGTNTPQLNQKIETKTLIPSK